MQPVANRLQGVLKDISGKVSAPAQVLIDCGESGINIRPKQYGDFGSHDGIGAPIYLELYEGELRLIVWSDINQQEPTHVISLEGAKESLRIASVADTPSSSLT